MAMACRVRYLNSSGIHLREIPGIQALAGAFPQQWLFYASLQCFPLRSYPIEIDALVVMDEGDESADDAIPEIHSSKAVSQHGDCWNLGKHRLLCADALQSG